MADLQRRVEAEASGAKLTPASAKGIRAERAKEVRRLRREGAWTSKPSPPPPPQPPMEAPAPAEGPAPTPEVPEPAMQPSNDIDGGRPMTILDRIRAIRDAARNRNEDQ